MMVEKWWSSIRDSYVVGHEGFEEGGYTHEMSHDEKTEDEDAKSVGERGDDASGSHAGAVRGGDGDDDDTDDGSDSSRDGLRQSSEQMPPLFADGYIILLLALVVAIFEFYGDAEITSEGWMFLRMLVAFVILVLLFLI